MFRNMNPRKFYKYDYIDFRIAVTNGDIEHRAADDPDPMHLRSSDFSRYNI